MFNTLIAGLPVVVAAIAAKQVSGLDGSGHCSRRGGRYALFARGIIGGLSGGIGAGILALFLIRLALSWNFPGTTANIVAGGISGLLAGLIVFFLISPIALMLGNGIRSLIESAVAFSPVLAGAIAGLLIWPAIIGGVYHAAILPIVLLEMETAGMSFLGAVDMTGLVMVSAGITLANIIYPRQRSEATVAAPGFAINMIFGTFVEAAYPFMFSDKIVFLGAILSAGLSGVFVGLFNVRGTAYVPSFTAPALSNNALGFAISMLVGLVSAFLFTVFANRLAKSRRERSLISMISADMRQKERARAKVLRAIEEHGGTTLLSTGISGDDARIAKSSRRRRCETPGTQSSRRGTGRNLRGHQHARGRENPP